MPRYLLTALTLLLCAGVVWAQESTPEPAPTVDVVATAQAVYDDAAALVNAARESQADTQNNVDLVLGFIEAAGIVVTVFASILVTIGVIVGVRDYGQLRQRLAEAKQEAQTLRDLQHSVEETMQADQARLAQQQARLNAEQQRLDDKLDLIDALPKTITTTLDQQQAEAEKQNEALALVQFAVRQIDIGNTVAAKRTLERALELSPDNRVTNFLLGEVNVRAGHYDEGLGYLLKAQPDDSDDDGMPDAKASLAYAYRMLGDNDDQRREELYGKASAIFNELLLKYPDLLDITGDSVYGGLGGLYRNQGRIEKAMEIYDLIADQTPYNSYPFNNMGLLHFQYDGRFGASRDKGLDYFRLARQKAQYNLKNEAAAYWQLFDLITAEVALGEAEWSRLQHLLDEVLDYRPPLENLNKLVRGLEQLRDAAPPPKHVSQALSYLKQRVADVYQTG